MPQAILEGSWPLETSVILNRWHMRLANVQWMKENMSDWQRQWSPNVIPLPPSSAKLRLSLPEKYLEEMSGNVSCVHEHRTWNYTDQIWSPGFAMLFPGSLSEHLLACNLVTISQDGDIKFFWMIFVHVGLRKYNRWY